MVEPSGNLHHEEHDVDRDGDDHGGAQHPPILADFLAKPRQPGERGLGERFSGCPNA